METSGNTGNGARTSFFERQFFIELDDYVFPAVCGACVGLVLLASAGLSLNWVGCLVVALCAISGIFFKRW
jgi:hypothetical protein